MFPKVFQWYFYFRKCHLYNWNVLAVTHYGCHLLNCKILLLWAIQYRAYEILQFKGISALPRGPVPEVDGGAFLGSEAAVAHARQLLGASWVAVAGHVLKIQAEQGAKPRPRPPCPCLRGLDGAADDHEPCNIQKKKRRWGHSWRRPRKCWRKRRGLGTATYHTAGEPEQVWGKPCRVPSVRVVSPQEWSLYRKLGHRVKLFGMWP